MNKQEALDSVQANLVEAYRTLNPLVKHESDWLTQGMTSQIDIIRNLALDIVVATKEIDNG